MIVLQARHTHAHMRVRYGNSIHVDPALENECLMDIRKQGYLADILNMSISPCFFAYRVSYE